MSKVEVTVVQRQEEPEHAACPSCGGEPEYNPQHQLRKLGYPHDDIVFTCSECGKKWTCGIPEEPNEDDGYRCDSCWKGSGIEVFGRPNWVHFREQNEEFELALKCPRCYHVWSVVRDAVIGSEQSRNTASCMVGDPAVSGRTDKGRTPFRT